MIPRHLVFFCLIVCTALSGQSENQTPDVSLFALIPVRGYKNIFNKNGVPYFRDISGRWDIIRFCLNGVPCGQNGQALDLGEDGPKLAHQFERLSKQGKREAQRSDVQAFVRHMLGEPKTKTPLKRETAGVASPPHFQIKLSEEERKEIVKNLVEEADLDRIEAAIQQGSSPVKTARQVILEQQDVFKKKWENKTEHIPDPGETHIYFYLVGSELADELLNDRHLETKKRQALVEYVQQFSILKEADVDFTKFLEKQNLNLFSYGASLGATLSDN